MVNKKTECDQRNPLKGYKIIKARQCPCVLPLDTNTKRKTMGVLSSRIIADIADNHGQSRTKRIFLVIVYDRDAHYFF